MLSAETRLLMFTSDHCPFCQAWERDIGTIYNKSPYAAHFPLQRVMADAGLPENISFAGPVKGTPTFIILSDRKEVGRFRGYVDAEMFWWQLSDFLPEDAVLQP